MGSHTAIYSVQHSGIYSTCHQQTFLHCSSSKVLRSESSAHPWHKLPSQLNISKSSTYPSIQHGTGRSSRKSLATVQAVLTTDPSSRVGNPDDKGGDRQLLESVLEAKGGSGALAETVEEVKELLSIKDYMLQVHDLIKPDGGPPRWFSPVDVGGYPTDAPLLLFIPGMDSTGLGLLLHQRNLARLFEVRCLHIPLYDQTPFEGLVAILEEAVRDESSKRRTPIYIVAESFGCCLTLSVAARNPELDLVLILANPATSFEQTPLQPLLPLLDITPAEAFRVVPFFLSTTLGNPVKMALAGLETDLSPLLRAQKLADALTGLLPTLPTLADILPKEVMQWKIKLIRYGARYTNSRLHAVQAEVLLLASGQDQMLPSADEAKRLKRILKKCQVRLFPENGHTLLLEEGLNLATVIKSTNTYRRGKTFDIIRDYTRPTDVEIKVARQGLETLRRFFSPISCSLTEEGQVRPGFPTSLDTSRPLLFVGNHTFVGFDLGFLVDEVLRQSNVLLRGLGHPIITMSAPPGENLVEAGNVNDSFRLMGVVQVNGSNLYKLLESGQSALLYPGGVREAFKRKGEAYKVIWPDRPEFVRIAIRHGATIVPVAAVGGDDIFEILLNPEELVSLPFIGENIRKTAEAIPRVRLAAEGEVANEAFVAPLGVPKPPPRMYFRYGKPIPTHGLSHLLRDRKATEEMYSHVKQEIEAGLSYLLEKREQDPYKDIIPRLLYEATWNKQAPTFEM